MGQFAYISERIPLLQQPNFLSILFFHFFLRLSITLFSSNHTAVCTEILIPTIHTFFNGFSFHTGYFGKYSNKELAHWIYFPFCRQRFYVIIFNVQAYPFGIEHFYHFKHLQCITSQS